MELAPRCRPSDSCSTIANSRDRTFCSAGRQAGPSSARDYATVEAERCISMSSQKQCLAMPLMMLRGVTSKDP